MGVAALALSEEKPTRRKVIGLVGGFVGLIIVVGPWNTDGFGSIGGQLACVGAAASYAVSFVYIRRFIGPHKLPALSVTAAQLGMASVITVVLTTFVTGWSLHGDLTAKPLLALLVLGAASTGIAFALLNRLIADAGPTTASGVNYLVPVFSVVVGVLALGTDVLERTGGRGPRHRRARPRGGPDLVPVPGRKPKPTAPVAPDRVPEESRS